MAELEKDNQTTPEAKELSKEKVVSTAEKLQSSVSKLVKVGGFEFLEGTVDGAQNLNPERKARKKIFLTEVEKKGERENLRKSLGLWIALISGSDTISDMITKSTEKSEAASGLLKQNLKKALDKTRDLEQSYRSVGLFYKNTEMDKLKNVTIMNATLDQLKDLDGEVFIKKVSEELKANYDRLDLRNNYSILVLPGYLGSNKVLEKWATIAYANKVMLVTDFENLENPDDVLDLFQSANLTGGEIHRSNVAMTCNWLVGRGKADEAGETEDLYVPGSSALAGTIYSTLMAQVAAGKKHGGMKEIDGVRFDLMKSEIGQLEKLGLIPMVKEYGKVMAFSAKTLFNGDNLGLQTYSVVRVFDWVTKVLIDFLNRRAFENFNVKTQMELRGQITKFLDSIQGPGKLIEKFRILKFEQDPVQKDKIYLDIYMVPYFPAKTFMIKLDGQKGTDPDSAEWKTEYEQQK